MTMERGNNRDSVSRRLGDDIDAKVLSHLLDNGSLPGPKLRNLRRVVLSASGFVAAITSMDADIVSAGPAQDANVEGENDSSDETFDGQQLEDTDMDVSDTQGGHSIIWGDETETTPQPEPEATREDIDVSMLVVADTSSTAAFSTIALSKPGHVIDTSRSQPVARTPRVASGTTVKKSSGFIDKVTETIDTISNVITGQDDSDGQGNTAPTDEATGQSTAPVQAEQPQSQPETRVNSITNNANTSPKSIADVIRDNPRLTPAQIADAIDQVDQSIVRETAPDVYARKLEDALGGSDGAISNDTDTAEPDSWNGTPIASAEPNSGNIPSIIDAINVESPSPEQSKSYALAEQLGTEEINQYVLEMVQSGGPIHLDELTEIYKNRPDLAEPVDGVSYLVKPLATELDYYTFSPGTDIPERRALPEQVAAQKVWTTYYNYLVRNDTRFTDMPLSNVEEGDAWSEEDHGEHDGKIPALDIRTVTIGGASYSGPAFTHGGERNIELEEEMLRMAARWHFTGYQLVKYMIYDPSDILNRVSDLDRQYPGSNSKSLVQPSKKGDHKDHIHIAFNVFGEETKLPYRWESNQEGYKNTTWEEVLAMNADWYDEMVSKHGLMPDMTPIVPSNSETETDDPGRYIIDPSSDENDAPDEAEEAPIDVTGVIVAMPEEETPFNGEPVVTVETEPDGEVQSGDGVNKLSADYESILDGTEGLSEDQKQFYKDAALAMETVHILRPDLKEINKAVKTGQMAVESGYGTSELATEAWNFSGNKASDDYNGPVYLKEDDERDASGKLVKSKFINYKKLWLDSGRDPSASRADIMAFSLEYNLEKFNSMSQVYGDAMQCAKDPFGFTLGIVHDMQTCRVIEGLQGQPGVQSYATGKGYVEAVMDRLENDQLDQVFNVVIDPEWRNYSAEIDRMQEEIARSNA